jgi:hypothetical protein
LKKCAAGLLIKVFLCGLKNSLDQASAWSFPLKALKSKGKYFTARGAIRKLLQLAITLISFYQQQVINYLVTRVTQRSGRYQK